MALVTGGSKGIGYGCAEALAAEGAAVSICARHQDELENAADTLREHGVDVLPVVADLTDDEDVDRLVDQTIERFGTVDILVNTVSPAFIETPLVNDMMAEIAEEQGVSVDEVIQSFLAEQRPHIELGRPGDIEEVGSLVAFLASEHASFVTGSNYRVDGGSVAAL